MSSSIDRFHLPFLFLFLLSRRTVHLHLYWGGHLLLQGVISCGTWRCGLFTLLAFIFIFGFQYLTFTSTSTFVSHPSFVILMNLLFLLFNNLFFNSFSIILFVIDTALTVLPVSLVLTVPPIRPVSHGHGTLVFPTATACIRRALGIDLALVCVD